MTLRRNILRIFTENRDYKEIIAAFSAENKDFKEIIAAFFTENRAQTEVVIGCAGVLASLVDLGKGLLAAGAIASLRLDTLPAGFAVWQMEVVVRLLAGVAAIIGHMYPVWAGFRGGIGWPCDGRGRVRLRALATWWLPMSRHSRNRYVGQRIG